MFVTRRPQVTEELARAAVPTAWSAERVRLGVPVRQEPEPAWLPRRRRQPAGWSLRPARVPMRRAGPIGLPVPMRRAGPIGLPVPMWQAGPVGLRVPMRRATW
jgi:hypothetical protein